MTVRSPVPSVVIAAVALWVAALAAVPARADLIGHGGTVRAVAVSPDGARVATGSFDYSAMLWEFSDQSEIAVLEGHEGPVNDVAFADAGRIVVTAADDGAVRLFDAADGAPLRAIAVHDHKAMGLAVSASGGLIASAGWDRTARLTTTAGDSVLVLDHPAPVNAVAFAAGDTLLATGSHDGVIRLFRLDDGAAAGELEGHGLGVTRLLAWDNATLISAGIDGSIRVWDLPTRSERAVLKKHDGQVYALARGPDGDLLSGGKDGQVLRWNLGTGAVVDAFAAHERMVWSMAATPDGRFVVTAGLEPTARVWHLASHDRIGLLADAAQDLEADRLWRESDHPGAPLYSKCARCHMLTAEGPQRSGPHLDGLFGRRVGTVEGYRYSQALTGSDIVWTEETVFDLFHLGPDKVLPGTKMPVQRLTDDAELTALIDFLKAATASGPQTTDRKDGS
jgi:cytochrome c